MHRKNGFSTCWPENDFRISYKFDFQGRIYLKVEIAVSIKNQNIDFQGRICLKVETRIFTKVDEMFACPPRCPKRSWGSQGAPQGVQRAPQDPFGTTILYIQTPDQPQSGHYQYNHDLCCYGFSFDCSTTNTAAINTKYSGWTTSVVAMGRFNSTRRVSFDENVSAIWRLSVVPLTQCVLCPCALGKLDKTLTDCIFVQFH